MTTEDRVRTWLASALADADQRGLAELKPLLEGLALATETLRRADWNDGPEGPLTTEAGGHGALPTAATSSRG